LAWWRSNTYDPADDLKAIGVPVLTIFGEIDTSLPVVENSPVLERYLTETGVRFDIVVIPDQPHSVTTCQGLYGADTWKWPEAYWNRSRLPPEFDETMAAGIVQQID